MATPHDPSTDTAAARYALWPDPSCPLRVWVIMQIMTQRRVGLFALAWTACGPTAPPPAYPPSGPTPTPTYAPAPTDEPLEITTPPAVGCELAYELVVQPTRDGLDLVAKMHNRTDRALRIIADNHCPAGVAVFTGLPDGVDPYHTCGMGACGATPPVIFDLAPGATRTLDTGHLELAGGGCNPPVAAGTMVSFRPIAEASGATVCAAPPVALAAPPPHVCAPMPACGIGCPGPMARDEHDCPLCACASDGLDGVR